MSSSALLVSLSALIVVGILTVVVSAGHGHFFQYANVPAWNAYEFGYNRGNHKHFTSRFEKKHGWSFKTKVRWGDKHGWGESYWDYNHADKGWKKGHGHGHQGWGWQKKGWGHHGHGSENVPVVASSSNNHEQRAVEDVQQVQPRPQQYYPDIRRSRY